MKINEIKVEKVMSVYSGIDGKCCCGCSGTHRYASAHREAASKNRGYPIKDNEVSDRSVKIVLRKLIQAAAENPESVDDRHSEFCSASSDGRIYIVYFLPAA